VPVVEFREVSYRIGGRTVLDRLSFALEPGETLALVGRSGSGKTTALRMVNAMALPAEGVVLVEGKPTTEWDPVRLRRRAGYVIQEGGLFPHLTVEQNIGLVLRLDGMPPAAIRDRADALLSLVGLDPSEFRRRYPRQLSGGQRQRVGVARALAEDPPVLLFDEPFGALDPVTRAEIQREFVKLAGPQRTSLFVTHDLAEAFRVASTIGLLHEGRLEYFGPVEGFRSCSSAEARAFLDSISMNGMS
jgi:osmoprotectant transport system ATP-binding protein